MFEHLLRMIAAALEAGTLTDDAALALRTTVEALATDETRGGLTAESLTAADEALTELFGQVRSGSIEGIAADDVETIRETGDAILAIRAEGVARAEQAEARAAEVAEIEARIARPTEGDTEGEAVEAEVAEVVAEAEAIAEQAAEPVAASLATLRQVQPAASLPAPQADSGVIITGPGGERLNSMAELAAITADAFTNARGARTSRAGGERLGRLRFPHPESRTLRGERADADKLEAVLADAGNPDRWGDEAIVASGGFCAPAEVDYSVPTVCEADRPVRDGLPAFSLPRGAVQVSTPPSLADITVFNGVGVDGAVSVWCNDTDEDPGVNTKAVQTIDCAAFSTFEACALVRRLRWGNFGAMALPENVAAWQELVLCAHARLGETRLLDQIKAASTARTTAKAFGAARDLAEAVARAAAQVRSVNRMRPDYRFRVLMPSWVVTLGSVDLVRGLQSDPGFLTDAERIFRDTLANAGVNVTLYLDTPSTGTSQILGLGAGPALSAWPGEVQWGLFPEGRFSFGNMETLDLGVYRSPELNDTNDVENFAESFEVAIDHGQGSALWVTSTVCPDGASAEGITVDVCPVGP